MPQSITAVTGLDTLSFCIEADTNKCAHPAVDHLPLDGVRLIGRNITTACADGNELIASEIVHCGIWNMLAKEDVPDEVFKMEKDQYEQWCII